LQRLRRASRRQQAVLLVADEIANAALIAGDNRQTGPERLEDRHAVGLAKRRPDEDVTSLKHCGHLVTGHVDGKATLVSRRPDARAERFEFEAPPHLARYIAKKGSACLDGVSLTINEVDGPKFSVCLIPHTLEITTLGRLTPGDEVNLEVDLIARYLERLMAPDYQGPDIAQE